MKVKHKKTGLIIDLSTPFLGIHLFKNECYEVLVFCNNKIYNIANDSYHADFDDVTDEFEILNN